MKGRGGVLGSWGGGVSGICRRCCLCVLRQERASKQISGGDANGATQ